MEWGGRDDLKPRRYISMPSSSCKGNGKGKGKGKGREREGKKGGGRGNRRWNSARSRVCLHHVTCINEVLCGTKVETPLRGVRNNDGLRGVRRGNDGRVCAPLHVI